MRAFWIDRNRNTGELIDTDATLTDFYRLCDCTCIDITVVRVGGQLVNVVVDDEGLLKPDPMASVFDKSGAPRLFGNVVFLGMNDEDDLRGLTDAQADAILNNSGLVLMSDMSTRFVTIVG